MRWQPALRVAPAYFDRAGLYRCARRFAQRGAGEAPFKPEKIIASFHGMPEEYSRKGDPYYCHCAETARLLRGKLKLDEDRLMHDLPVALRPGRVAQALYRRHGESLAEQGVKSLAVITPGFAADCLETLEEIAMENAEIFKAAGGKNFAAIPCLNDSAPAWR